MHCLEDFRKYFFEIILTEMFSKFNLLKISRYMVYYYYRIYYEDVITGDKCDIKTITLLAITTYVCICNVCVLQEMKIMRYHQTNMLKLDFLLDRLEFHLM